MNWDTEELIDTILNDEGLYLTFTSTTWTGDDVRNQFRRGLPPGIDRNEVDFEQVAEFVNNDL